MIKYPDIDPIAFNIGAIQIHWYGITYIAGIAIAWWLLLIRANRFNGYWIPEQVTDLIFYCAVGLILGGRLGSVIFYNMPYYLAHPVDIIKIWQGGMSFHGGLIGVLVAIWFFGKKYSRGFFIVSDYLAPVVPVGLGCGRVGNFINGELWGAASDLPWAMIFPHANAGPVPRHPSQLYEAFLEGLVLFIILWWFSSHIRPQKAVSGLFLLLYGIFRFAVEFVREPDVGIGYLAGGWLTMGQILSAPMIIFGVVLLVLAYRKKSSM